MAVQSSLLTGKIYYVSGKNKVDITDEAINAVTIRFIEGHYNNIIVVSKLDNRKYELCIKEIV